MKKVFNLLFLTLLLFTSNSCEKDDLCTPDQAVTPRLVIEFKDALSPLENKPVERLQVQEIGSTEFAPLNNEGATTLTSVENISIPLRTDRNRTSYNFILNESGVLNSDNIDFTYNLGEEYVSRACGFRVIYDGLIAVLTPESTGTQWVQNVAVVEQSITNNTDIHVQILH
ncbi:MAG: DUF6452 family protein [Nonlabens sp.]|uniref:DUF6452 family protein n=1 Tax=Nonlabens sp. TaxID=1888209 RepID=UPI00321AF563